MKKSGWISLFLVCIAVILIGGCTNAELGVVENTPAPAPATLQATATTIIPTTNPLTTWPTVIITTKATMPPTPNLKPMAAPVTLKGFGNEFVKFTTQAPGIVSFGIREYDAGCKYKICKKKVSNCGEEKFVVNLGGSSIDQRLFIGDTGREADTTKTFNLINPGSYTLAVKSCYEWQIIVSNA